VFFLVVNIVTELPVSGTTMAKVRRSSLDEDDLIKIDEMGLYGEEDDEDEGDLGFELDDDDNNDESEMPPSDEDESMSLVPFESFDEAMAFLDEEIRNSGLSTCEKMILQSAEGDPEGEIFFVAIDLTTVKPIRGSQGVFVHSGRLTKKDHLHMKRMNMISRKDLYGDADDESPMTKEREIELLHKDSSFIHSEKPAKKGRRRKKDCD